MKRRGPAWAGFFPLRLINPQQAHSPTVSHNDCDAACEIRKMRRPFDGPQ
jgi:hypothetical protein